VGKRRCHIHRLVITTVVQTSNGKGAEIKGTNSNWDEMSCRSKDAWAMQHVFKLPVKWFPCWRDPECGTLQVQSLDPDEPDMSGFGGTKEPCYWSEDRDESFRNDPVYWEVVPLYSTDAAADYEILNKVRETWSKERIWSFYQHLHDVWGMRVNCGMQAYPNGDELVMLYEPGDYLKSCWLVLENK